MKLIKKTFVRRLFLFSFIFIFTFIINGLCSLKTSAKSNIDFNVDATIFDYRYSNFIISASNFQLMENNLIYIEFYDSDGVLSFDVEFFIPSQGIPSLFIDSEFSFDIMNIYEFNFIDFLILSVEDISSDYDYISTIENGYFEIIDIDIEIYNLIVNSDYFNVDFILYEPTITDRLFNFFITVATSFIVLFNGLVAIFYVDSHLTFMGILAIIGLGISLILLFIVLISNFLKFRG